MYTALQKIHKERDAEPSEFEENVAQVLPDSCYLTFLHVFIHN